MGNGRMKDHWRDTDMRIEAPVIESLQDAFVENWLEATGNVLGGAPYFPTNSQNGSVAAQIEQARRPGDPTAAAQNRARRDLDPIDTLKQ
jgi:phosphatidylserine/phosphatidylglycerophosphate/cardiolipin synthase-like enzyme